MIIGIAGTIGAGKGTVVDYLKSKGFVQYSTSKLLGEILDQEGKSKIRDNYSPLATRLQQEYPGGAVEKNYQEKYLAETPEDAVFEALHRQSEADFLKSAGAIIIGVDADLKTRYERIHARQEGEKDQVTFQKFTEDARIEDEGEGDVSRDNNIRAVIDSADFAIRNDGTLKELHAKVDAVLEELDARK